VRGSCVTFPSKSYATVGKNSHFRSPINGARYI